MRVVMGSFAENDDAPMSPANEFDVFNKGTCVGLTLTVTVPLVPPPCKPVPAIVFTSGGTITVATVAKSATFRSRPHAPAKTVDGMKLRRA